MLAFDGLRRTIGSHSAQPMRMLETLDGLSERVENLKSKNLYRNLCVLDELKGVSANIDDRHVTLFCGNDYLGLSQHPKVVLAAQKTLKTHGVGAGSARLIAGTTEVHNALEEKIAAFLKKERALLFSSGYLANLGVLTALPRKNDLILIDKLSHASLIDAAHASQATVRVFPHKNLNYLERILKKYEYSNACVWIVTDSIFSMDGDLAPLRELAQLKNKYNALLVIDEAHATGVFGEKSRGVSETLGVAGEIDVHIGTCSKAVGSLGGFVAGKSEVIESLINFARTFIFDTALPPAICAASIAAFEVMGSDPKPKNRLWENIKFLRAQLKAIGAPVPEGQGPIVPVVIGDEKKTLEVAQSLLVKGFLVPAVRYPTVSKGKARLRVTISAVHQKHEIGNFVKAMEKVL